MAKLEWDKTGEHFYETGLSKGVLYPYSSEGYTPGVVWNGLTSLTESPSGAELTDLWADDIKYASLRSAETFGATIEAYTYPKEFAECDGSAEVVTGVYIGQQTRKTFGLSYVTQIGNDTGSDSVGYKLHLIWGATAAPSERQRQTVNDSPEAMTMSWELSTTPVSAGADYKPTAYMEIDSTKVDAAKLAALEKILYGDGTATARLPLPTEVINILKGTNG